MKRFLLSLVAIVITSVCFAQDIIVQKDGSTIKAKVTKVTQSEVEYKKFNNQKGPTYTISTKDLQCINYENGTKDTFVSPNYNPNIVTNETATQFSNDEQLLAMYNNAKHHKKNINSKARKLRTIGWAVAPAIALGGFFAGGGLAYAMGCEEEAQIVVGGVTGLAAGATWVIMFDKAARRAKKQSGLAIVSSPLFQQEFKVGKNDRLMVGVDMLKDNTRRNQTLGLGVSYNF